MGRLRLSPAWLEAIAVCSALALQHFILIGLYASAATVGTLLVIAIISGEAP